MTAFCCKVCGDSDHRVTPQVLEDLGLETIPPWLEGQLCLTCLDGLSSHTPKDEEGYVIGKITPANYVTFLSRELAAVAWRISSKRSPDRCEALDNRYRGDYGARCTRFVAHVVDGRGLCGPHNMALRRGSEIGFINSGYRRPVAHVILARDGSELFVRASHIAAGVTEHAYLGLPG